MGGGDRYQLIDNKQVQFDTISEKIILCDEAVTVPS